MPIYHYNTSNSVGNVRVSLHYWIVIKILYIQTSWNFKFFSGSSRVVSQYVFKICKIYTFIVHTVYSVLIVNLYV